MYLYLPIFIKKNYTKFTSKHGKKVLRAFIIVDQNQFKELKILTQGSSTDVTKNVYSNKKESSTEDTKYEGVFIMSVIDLKKNKEVFKGDCW